ncbi:MAG TPA: adenylate/guanylate cyclase domain-containing protein [Polyangiaceae bacterium]|nr:adenylate/guanylate cyclase domain-containing protein [Polyangiaceae bacterium]
MNDEDRERLRLLERERKMVADVDDILEEALRDRLPIEAYARRTLAVLAEAIGAKAVLLRTYDESLDVATFDFPEGGALTAARGAAIATTTDRHEDFVDRGSDRTVFAQPLDVAGELFGLVAAEVGSVLDDAALADARELLHAFAETIDNQLAFIAAFRKKSLVSRELGDALLDPVLDRGIDRALEILKAAVAFDDLLLVVREENAGTNTRLTYRIIQGGVLTDVAELRGQVGVDEFMKTHAATMIHGDSRALLARLGITRFREEALIQGMRDKRVLGKLVVTSRRGELSTFDRDLIERFCDILRQRLVDHGREWRHLGHAFPGSVVERLLAEEDYAQKRLTPREREVAILFADISGFTRISERVLREPALIAKLVDLWSQRVVQELYDLGGVFDKMVGDCVIALFGPPLFDFDGREACRRALELAIRIRDITQRFNDGADLAPLRGIDPPVGISIGLHYGPVFVGTVGPNDNYTAFGSVMNNAARLQGIAKRDQILAMDAFVTALAAPQRFGPEESAPVKNVSEPLRFRALAE